MDMKRRIWILSLTNEKDTQVFIVVEVKADESAFCGHNSNLNSAKGTTRHRDETLRNRPKWSS